ncbi:MAG: radical SAM protein [Candidatus Eiseniibacteriota bacterium]|nr:MAG: radical SAM protein [Candidatus Eisenbacteria bacterium]
MIGFTKLICGTEEIGDELRYGRDSSKLPSHLLQFSTDKKPIVVWNSTRQCNLSCIHCYIEASPGRGVDELSTEEARRMIDDLAEFGVPVLLFSGGEPLLRKDLYELGDYAVSKGLRTVISTNGVLITEETAKRIKASGFSYVGVSLDGMEETNDCFRGKKGAFRDALTAIRNCREAGVKVGLRFTINRHNYHDLERIFELLKTEQIPRCCFYHLVYAGRGSSMVGEDVSLDESRAAAELIYEKTKEFCRDGVSCELLTVDNHTDGVFLYLKMREENPERAEKVLELLRWNGGNNSGIAIACVGPTGEVHPDQFWRHHSFGNVRERRFGEIWTDIGDPLMAGLKDRKHLLTGRCGSCKFLDICNGNFRVRAEAVYGDIWAPDPACYLTDEEIGSA